MHSLRLAVTLDLDPDADPKRAAKYFRKALENKPDEARYWSGYGQICLRLGKEKGPIKHCCCRRPCTKTVTEILDEIADGLCFLGKDEDARSVLMASRFRLGHDAQLEMLWNRFRFLELHRKQQSSKRRQALEEGSAVILPFVPSKETSGTPKGEPGILRNDCFSFPSPHANRLNGKNSDPAVLHETVSNVYRSLFGPPCFQVYGKGRFKRDWHIVDVYTSRRRDCGSGWPFFSGTCITWTASVIAVGQDFAEQLLREQSTEPASQGNPVLVEGAAYTTSTADLPPLPSLFPPLRKSWLTNAATPPRPAVWVVFMADWCQCELFRQGPHWWNRFENEASEIGRFGGIVTK